MPDIITQTIILDVREIRAKIPFEAGGETLEHRFRVNLFPARDVSMGSREVSVFVQFEGNEPGEFPVLVTLNRPDGTIAAGPIRMTNRPSPGLPIIHSPIGTLPGVMFAINTGTGRPPGLGEIGPGGEDPPPPPPEIERLSYTIATPDPNGVWSVTMTNTGDRDGIFRILIVHPGAQKPLRTSRVPHSLVTRFIDKVKKLTSPSLRIDRRARIDFSPEFTHLTGIGPQRFGDGLPVRDVNMDQFDVGVLARNGAVTVHGELRFETGGPDEISTPAPLPDIDVTALEFELDMILGSQFSNTDSSITMITNPRPVLTEQRDLSGRVNHEMVGRVSLQFILTTDVEAEIISKFTDLNERIQNAFREAILGEDGRRKLPVLAEHITDALMFLATGSRKELFFDVRSDGTDIIVEHYARPSILDFVTVPGPGDGEVALASTGASVGPDDGAEVPSPGIATGSRVFRAAAVETAAECAEHKTAGEPDTSPASPATASIGGPITGEMLAALTSRGVTGDPDGDTPPTAAFDLTGATLEAPTGTGTIFDPDISGGASGRRIEHIVVLMMENRSFDHILGYLSLEKGRGDVDGLSGPLQNTNPVPSSQTPQGVFELDFGNILVDPDHSHGGTLEQIANGEMSGFVASYLKKDPAPSTHDRVMGYYNDAFLNIYDYLAREYKVCDRWFCSHPGPTYPNRFISLSGQTPSLNNIEIGGDLAGAVKDRTIFDILTAGGVSWNYVESNIAFLRMFDRYRVDERNIIQRQQFIEKAKAGQLPAVTWIDPNFGELEIDNEANDDHPPADVRQGQALIHEIYTALTAIRSQWNRTLFVITYDEHGGFYDHVPPHGLDAGAAPAVPRIHPDGTAFYGPRVPAFLISPWIARGVATDRIFDHTSILKSILVNFVGPEAATQGLLGARVDAAEDLLSELESTRRSDTPEIPDPLPVGPPTPTGALAGRPIERDSFHLGVRLFPFGPKLKDLIGI